MPEKDDIRTPILAYEAWGLIAGISNSQIRETLL
jgi:hypothetical protein